MIRTNRLIPSPVYRPNVGPAWGASQTRFYLRIHSPRGGIGYLNTNARGFGRSRVNGGRVRGVYTAQVRGFSRTACQKTGPDWSKWETLSTKEKVANVLAKMITTSIMLYGGYRLAKYLEIIPKDYYSRDNEHPVFDPPRFTPFEIVKREQVSGTSVVLTLRPKRGKGKGVDDPYGREWDVGTWSVEFKQPELMIAREYTPLPPVPKPKEGEEADLRFLVRKEVGGEMSGYLFALPEGYVLNLRGPKTELGLRGKEGHCDGARVKEVVFMAGGTGIASALQVAHILLDRGNAAKEEDKPKIKILWSNRRTEDRRQSGPILEAIADLKLKHQGNFDITYLVDEEGTFVNSQVIAKAMRTMEPTKPAALHSKTQTHMVLVSGPQGYVEYIAGAKKWENGKEQQGAVGGLLEKMGVRSTRWTVWKL